MGSTKGAVALERHAAISNMISGLSTRNIEESAREAVLIEPVSNPSTLISMVLWYSNIYDCSTKRVATTPVSIRGGQNQVFVIFSVYNYNLISKTTLWHVFMLALSHCTV